LALELPQTLTLGELGVELGTELGLPARSLEKEHEIARHLERELPAVILLHERQGEIHPCRHAR